MKGQTQAPPQNDKIRLAETTLNEIKQGLFLYEQLEVRTKSCEARNRHKLFISFFPHKRRQFRELHLMEQQKQHDLDKAARLSRTQDQACESAGGSSMIQFKKKKLQDSLKSR